MRFAVCTQINLINFLLIVSFDNFELIFPDWEFNVMTLFYLFLSVYLSICFFIPIYLFFIYIFLFLSIYFEEFNIMTFIFILIFH